MNYQVINNLKCRVFNQLFNYLVAPICETGNILLITGSPRSGTTWLGNILSSPPGFININEPFHSGRLHVKGVDISWRPSPAELQYCENKKIYRDIASGKIITPDMLIDNSFHSFFRCKTLVFKCVRANRILSYLCGLKFKSTPVYLLRHPLAVVASQISHCQFPIDLKLPDYDREYLDHYFPGLTLDVLRFRHEEEFRALTWCLDQHVALTDPDRGKWLTVYYEKLVLGGCEELSELYCALGLELPGNIEELHKTKSRESQAWSSNPSEPDVEKRIGAWKNILTKEQVDRILDVLSMFEFRGYGENVLPDFGNIGMG